LEKLNFYVLVSFVGRLKGLKKPFESSSHVNNITADKLQQPFN